MVVKGDTQARFWASSAGCVVAEACTVPIDLSKVRLQVQAGSTPKYSGLLDCMRRTAAEEGVASLWKGITPALLRQLTYHNFSMVMYEPCRNFFASDRDANFMQRLLAGGTSGAMGITMFNPIEVIKTQLQTHRDGSMRMRDVASKIWRVDGLSGFWAGLVPNVARTFIVCAAELGVYDEAKCQISAVIGNGFPAHLSASGIAGVASACVSTPADVVKTRLMNTSGGVREYSGVLDAVRRIPQEEGVQALYKGFTAICLRKVVWCGVFFVSYEQFREAYNSQFPLSE